MDTVLRGFSFLAPFPKFVDFLSAFACCSANFLVALSKYFFEYFSFFLLFEFFQRKMSLIPSYRGFNRMFDELNNDMARFDRSFGRPHWPAVSNDPFFSRPYWLTSGDNLDVATTATEVRFFRKFVLTI